MCVEALEEHPWTLRFVSNCFTMPAMLLDNLNTQDRCDKAVYSEYYLMEVVPESLNVQDMCIKENEKDI